MSFPANPISASAQAEARWRPNARRHAGEWAVKGICLLCALLSILTTFGIVFVLARESFHFFKEVSFAEYFTGTVWEPINDKFGVLPLVSGTLMITVGAGLIALPLGLLAAVYLSEYASQRTRNIVKPLLEILAGIPTVVYGYFAVFFVTPLLRQFFPSVEVFNAASGCIVVGIMILPLVSSLCEDAIAAVPKALREGAYGLGSNKFEVTAKIVMPAALSGIMAAFILALSRAIGETMAVSLACGSTPQFTLNPAKSIETMTAFIVRISKGDTPAGTTAYYTLFAVGMTLFVMTLVMNFISLRLVKRFRLVYQ